MQHRRAMIVGVAAIGLLLAAVEGWRLYARPIGINQRGFESIRDGMTLEEVQALLGGPPGSYSDSEAGSSGFGCLARVWISRRTESSDYRQLSWSRNGCSIEVFFRADGAVADKGFVDFDFPPPSLLDRVRQRLGI